MKRVTYQPLCFCIHLLKLLHLKLFYLGVYVLEQYALIANIYQIMLRQTHITNKYVICDTRDVHILGLRNR